MNKKIVSLLTGALLCTFALVGCNTTSKSTTPTAPAKSTVTTKPTTSTSPVTESKASETIPEMKAFMGMLNGKSDSVTAALSKYSATGVDTADMDMWGLDKPEVDSSREAAGQKCYLMKAKSGATERKFDLCWKDGKIQAVTDKGITPGVIR